MMVEREYSYGCLKCGFQNHEKIKINENFSIAKLSRGSCVVCMVKHEWITDYRNGKLKVIKLKTKE